jgi:hypothetical protein
MTKGEKQFLLIAYAKAVMKAGYAVDLPQRYLPKELKWKNWLAERK